MKWPRPFSTVIPEVKRSSFPLLPLKNAGVAVFPLSAGHQGEVPKDMPVFLDSPLAIKATEIFRRHHTYLDADTQNILKNVKILWICPQLKFSSSTEQSMRSTNGRVAIVISASGMSMPDGSGIIYA
jgi:hypothetical protein